MTARQILTAIRNALAKMLGKPRPELSTRDQVAGQLERSATARRLNPVLFACRSNGLTPAQTAVVVRHFDLVNHTDGPTEARTQAVNLAASIGKTRDRRRGYRPDPWHGPKAA